MLTTIPVYDQAHAIAIAVITAINEAFPTLEAQVSNTRPLDPLKIQVRNPLNGNCWTTVVFMWPNDRAAD